MCVCVCGKVKELCPYVPAPYAWGAFSSFCPAHTHTYTPSSSSSFFMFIHVFYALTPCTLGALRFVRNVWCREANKNRFLPACRNVHVHHTLALLHIEPHTHTASFLLPRFALPLLLRCSHFIPPYPVSAYVTVK